jgi:hypothetical protein
VGTVAYKLLLPEHTSVHPVFHVSQLKKALPPATQVSSDIPDTSKTDAFRFLVKILQRRMKPDGDQLVTEVLVQWSSWPPSMAAWELEAELQDQFPAALAWGQTGIQERRNVRKMVGAKQNKEKTSEAPSDGAVDGPMTVKPKHVIKPNAKYFGPNWVNR